MPHRETIRRTFQASLVAALLTAATAAGDAGSLDLGDPRQLPSLEILWQSGGGRFDFLAVADGVAYVAGYRTLAAFDIATGDLVWDRQFRHRLLFPGFLVLEDNLVAVFGYEIHLVDRQSGTTVGLYHTPEGVSPQIAGPPLVLWFSHRGEDGKLQRVGAVRRDEETAGVTAERTFQASSRAQLWVHGGHPVLRLGFSEGRSYHSTLQGLDGDDLTTLWELPDGKASWFGSELYLDVGAGDGRRLHAFDPATGRRGEALAAIPETCGFDRIDRHGLAASYRHEPPIRLRRFDTGSGETLWTRTLPGPAGGRVVLGDRLLVHCAAPAGGRGTLLELGWADGELRRAAYGLDRSVLAAWEDRLITLTADGLVAFASDRFGPPEAATRGVDGEVRRILAEVERRGNSRFRDYHAVAELKSLGDEALPVLTGLLDQIGPAAFQVAARALAEAAYHPAGHLLGPRLGPRLLDPEAPGRRRAWLALAGIGSPETLAWIDRALEQPVEGNWWTPPDAGPALELLRDAASSEEGAADDAAARYRRQQRRHIRLLDTAGEASGGERLLIFPHPDAGALDLWAATVDPEGRPGPATYLDVSLARLVGWFPDHFCSVPPEFDLEANLEGRTLHLRTVGDETATATVDLDEVYRDTDGDGLSDLFERSLGTDPAAADSDGDGRPDGEDRAPIAEVGAPRNEEEEILVAIFEAFFRFHDPRMRQGIAVIIDAPALEWRGREGPTLHFNQGGRAVRLSGLSLSIRLAEEREELQERRDQLRPGERLYLVSTSRGEIHTAVVAKIGSRWVVRKIDLWSIS